MGVTKTEDADHTVGIIGKQKFIGAVTIVSPSRIRVQITVPAGATAKAGMASQPNAWPTGTPDCLTEKARPRRAPGVWRARMSLLEGGTGP